MSRQTHVFGAVFWGSMVLAAAHPLPLLAQQRDRGLFGSGRGKAEQAVIFSGSLVAGTGETFGNSWWNTTLFGPQPDQQLDGNRSSYGDLSTALSYSFQRARMGLNAGVGSSLRYFSLNDQFASAHEANVGGTISLTRRTQLNTNHALGYSPYYPIGLFPDQALPATEEVAPPNLNLSTSRGATISFSSSIDLTHALSSRSSVLAGYGRQRTDFKSGDWDLTSQSATVGFNRRLTRHAGLRLGYSYLEAHSGGSRSDDRFRGHSFDAGIDYSRALSLSRKTTFSFALGSTAVNDTQTTNYMLTGTAGLNHQIGRSWYAAANYDRSVDFFGAAFNEPFLSDSVTGGVGGLLTGRLEFAGSATYSRASQIGAENRGGSYDASSGSATLQYGLSRFLGLMLEYGYYRYDIGEDLDLLPGLSRKLNRHSVSGGLVFWVPLYTRTGRSNVTR